LLFCPVALTEIIKGQKVEEPKPIEVNKVEE